MSLLSIKDPVSQRRVLEVVALIDRDDQSLSSILRRALDEAAIYDQCSAWGDRNT